jgi:hypothetical protein
MVNTWLRERHGRPEDPLFSSPRGNRLRRDAVEHRIKKYTHLAARTCPSLKEKKVSPHLYRDAVAMDLLHHGVDPSVVALWLGHESVMSTQMHLHADMRLKEQALSRTAPLSVIECFPLHPAAQMAVAIALRKTPRLTQGKHVSIPSLRDVPRDSPGVKFLFPVLTYS